MDRAGLLESLSGYAEALRRTKRGVVLNEDFFFSLIGLAADLGRLFAPVRPDKTFRRHLSKDLLSHAQARPPQSTKSGHKALLWGAILGSLLSLIGITLCILLRREHRGPVEERCGTGARI